MLGALLIQVSDCLSEDISGKFHLYYTGPGRQGLKRVCSSHSVLGLSMSQSLWIELFDSFLMY